MSGASNNAGNYQEIGEKPIVPGCYYLEPHWEMDYVEETRRVLERGRFSALIAQFRTRKAGRRA